MKLLSLNCGPEAIKIVPSSRTYSLELVVDFVRDLQYQLQLLLGNGQKRDQSSLQFDTLLVTLKSTRSRSFFCIGGSIRRFISGYVGEIPVFH